MMKRVIAFSIIAAGILTASCNKEKPSEDSGVALEEESGEIQEILIGGILGESEVVSRASVDAWAGQELYVVGYDTVRVSSATKIDEKSGFVIPNEKGTAPSGVNPGMMTFSKSFYYDEGISYDFNGYYVGGDTVITSPLAVNSGLLSLGIRIDGSQDILGATTDKEQDRVIPDEYCEKYGYEKGTKVKTEYVYSSFAARRGVQPKLNFEHLLSKFTFAIKLGEDLPDTSKIHPKKISLRAKPNGRFVLNPRNAGGAKVNSYVTPASDDTVTIGLDCGGITPLFSDYTNVPGCLMVIPEEEEYVASLSFTQDHTDGKEHSLTFPIKIKDVTFYEETKKTDTFKAGKQYAVKIIVYGLQKIEVKVYLKQWDDVGSFVYDPDKIEGI